MQTASNLFSNKTSYGRVGWIIPFFWRKLLSGTHLVLPWIFRKQFCLVNFGKLEENTRDIGSFGEHDPWPLNHLNIQINLKKNSQLLVESFLINFTGKKIQALFFFVINKYKVWWNQIYFTFYSSSLIIAISN